MKDEDEGEKEGYQRFIIPPSSFRLHPYFWAECRRDYMIRSETKVSTKLSRQPLSAFIEIMANAGVEYMVSESDRVQFPARLLVQVRTLADLVAIKNHKVSGRVEDWMMTSSMTHVSRHSRRHISSPQR